MVFVSSSPKNSATAQERNRIKHILCLLMFSLTSCFGQANLAFGCYLNETGTSGGITLEASKRSSCTVQSHSFCSTNSFNFSQCPI
jgi:hypothetical protein